MFDTRIKPACFACASQQFNAQLLSRRYTLWKLADLIVGALFFFLQKDKLIQEKIIILGNSRSTRLEPRLNQIFRKKRVTKK